MLTFGAAWIVFALAVAAHVADEAAHDFLAFYNPIARSIRRRLHLPVPTFRFSVWLGGLIAGVLLLLLLSPQAFAGDRWLHIAAWPLAILVGLGNAALHAVGSVRYRRVLPGLYSSPLLFAAGGLLLCAA